MVPTRSIPIIHVINLPAWGWVLTVSSRSTLASDAHPVQVHENTSSLPWGVYRSWSCKPNSWTCSKLWQAGAGAAAFAHVKAAAVDAPDLKRTVDELISRRGKASANRACGWCSELLATVSELCGSILTREETINAPKPEAFRHRQLVKASKSLWIRPHCPDVHAAFFSWILAAVVVGSRMMKQVPLPVSVSK